VCLLVLVTLTEVSTAGDDTDFHTHKETKHSR